MTTQTQTPKTPAQPLRQQGRADAVETLFPPWLDVVTRIVMGALVAIPVAYIFISSLAADADIAQGRVWPTSWHPENYVNVWKTVDLAAGLGNSLLVAGAAAVVSALMAVGTAYVLARYAFRGRLTILRGLVGMQSLPGNLLLLPIFVLYSSAASYLHITIIGTRWGLFLTYLTFALPFATWVMVTYLRGLPRELEEAARIDGASTIGVLTRIVVPLSWPGIVVAGIFSFLLGWNDVMFASTMTTPQTRTAAVVLQVFGASTEGGALPMYGQMMAAALICATPVVALYLFFQKYLVSGLTAGGVK